MGKRKKLTKMEQMMEVLPCSGLNLTRYTYESWMKCYPGSDREVYELSQSPDSLMDFLADAVCRHFPNKMPKADFKLGVKLIDDDYFKWLSGREDTTKMRSSYANEDQPVSKLQNAHLDVTRMIFGIPVAGITTGTEMDMRLDKETTNAIAKFFTDLVADPAYSLYVPPYVLSADDFEENEDKLLQMSKAKFEDNVDVEYDQFAKQRLPGENAFVLCFIPVVVQIKHNLGNLTIGDVLAYMGEDFQEAEEYYGGKSQLSRLFWLLGYDEKDRENMPRFVNSDAGKAIFKWELDRFIDVQNNPSGAKKAILPVLLTCEEAIEYEEKVYTGIVKKLAREKLKMRGYYDGKWED